MKKMIVGIKTQAVCLIMNTLLIFQRKMLHEVILKMERKSLS